MGFLTDHPYTAITVTIDRLVTDQYEEDDVAGIFELIETIRLSPTGPTEAARAIRKKLKYGSVHNQLRALTILDSLIENGGKRFQSSFADEPLLERLRIVATDSTYDSDVRKKCSRLFLQWASAYKDTPGMAAIVQLHKQLPQRKRPAPKRQQRFVDMDDDMDDEDEDAPPPRPQRPGTSSEDGSARSRRRARGGGHEDDDYDDDGDGHDRRPRSAAARSSSTPRSQQPTKHIPKKTQVVVSTFDLAKEKPKLMQVLAESGTAATNLQNSLKLINREEKLATDDMAATENFNRCRQLRRMVLRYIQHIESEDYIGSLIHANEELIAALQTYDKMSQPIENDSDSEGYESASSSSDGEQSSGRGVQPTSSKRRSASMKPSGKAAAAGATAGGGHRRTPSADVGPRKPTRPTADQLAHKRKPPPVPAKSAVLQEFKSKLVLDSPKPTEEDDDPFGDANKIETPAVERSQPTWREV